MVPDVDGENQGPFHFRGRDKARQERGHQMSVAPDRRVMPDCQDDETRLR